jgi:hypothetical protein
MSMKNILFGVSTFLFYAIAACGQWSSDPANPLLVCNVANAQHDAQAVADGSGGTYVFWRDSREVYNIHKIYGQRYDENGFALWEENGRIIIEDEDDIQFFRLYRYDDGKMIIGWYNGVSERINSIFITNNKGKRIWQSTPVMQSIQVDFSHLPKGVYTLTIMSTDKTTHEHIVVTK